MISEATKEDQLEIDALLINYFNIDHPISDPYARWLVYKEDIILGFINYSIIYERAELNYILVLLKFRRNNIASKLLETMLIELKQKNVKTITLEVNVNNTDAISFYKKYGFEIISVRKNYYQNEDAYLMLKEVGD